MPRQSKSVPSYLHHKPTDQAYVRVPDGRGGRRVVYLGKYDSKESQAEYRQVLAELQAQPAVALQVRLVTPKPSRLTVNEVLLAFMRWAVTHYRTPKGKPTSEIGELKWSLRLVRELYGHTRAAEFGPRALDAVRGEMIRLGWCRTLINRRIDRVKRAFGWPHTPQYTIRYLPGSGQ